MPTNDEVVIISASLSSQGPTGPRGPKGDVGFLQFEIRDGNLILINETPKEMNFVISNGNLIMEVAE